jgi:hypothetical protein
MLNQIKNSIKHPVINNTCHFIGNVINMSDDEDGNNKFLNYMTDIMPLFKPEKND